MQNTTIAVILLSGLLVMSGCTDQTENKTTEKSKPLQNTQTAVDPHANLKLPTNQTSYPAAKPALNGGIAVNVIHSGGYTYIEIINQGKSIWLAGSQTTVQPGQQVYWGEAAIMHNFTSKTLGRTFAEILFVSKFIVSQGETQNQTAIASPTGKVLSAQSAGGYTYLEVNTKNGNIWIAAPQATINVNDNVGWTGASKMTNFTSKTLNKTFAEIFFVSSVNVIN